MLRRLIAGLAFLCAIPTALAETIEAPSGWRTEQSGDIHILQKSESGERMTVRVMPWRSLDGLSLKAWLRKYGDEDFGPLTVTEMRFANLHLQAATDIEGAQMAILPRHVDTTTPHASLLLACAREGRVRLANAYGTSDALRNRNLTGQAPTILANACKSMETIRDGQQRAIIQDRDDIKISTMNRPKLSAQHLPKGADLWYYADVKAGAMGAVPFFRSAVIFPDGAVSDDDETILSQGVTASQKQNPQDWGRWRKVGAKVEFDWKNSGKFKSYMVSANPAAGKSDHRLTGCYASKSGATLGLPGSGTASMSVNRWCFSSNGRFANDKSVAISGASGGGESVGQARSDKSGWYRIDGHVIQLVYDNGQRFIRTYGEYDGGVLLGGFLYRRSGK